MSEIDFKKMAKEDMQDLQGNESMSEFIADLYERLYLTDPQFRQDLNENSDKPTYTHDYSFVFTVPHDTDRDTDIKPAKVVARFLETVREISHQEIYDRCEWYNCNPEWTIK